MKRFSGYFFVSGLMLGSLLLQYDPASAQFGDPMAHFGNSTCGSHMIDPTPLGNPSPSTFYLCRGISGATDWSAEIRKDAGINQLVCTLAKRPTGGTNYTWSTCNIPNGSYRAILTYYVGTTKYVSNPPDKVFTKP